MPPGRPAMRMTGAEEAAEDMARSGSWMVDRWG
jgi:hypothetical protein